MKVGASTGKRNQTRIPFSGGGVHSEGGDDYDLGTSRIVAEAQIDPETDYPNYDDVDLNNGPPPHVCLNLYPKAKYRPLCHVFNKEQKDISLQVSDISGYTEIDGDGKCHYPLSGKSLRTERIHLLYKVLCAFA